MKNIKTIVREPLSHFLLLGALIFLLNEWSDSGRKDQIIITPALRNYLIESQEQLRLKSLTELEIQQVIDAYVREEMLYREAYKRGLDKNDARMRQNLVRKMYGLIQTELPQPSEAQLRTFHGEHPELFLSPATMTVEQVFFRDPNHIPEDILVGLQAGLDFSTQGKTMANFGRIIRDVTLRVIAREFGVETAKAIEAVDHNKWFGPVESRHGSHFFRIAQRHPPIQWGYEDVAGELNQLWFQKKSEELLSTELQQIAADYEVVYRGSDSEQ